MSSIFDDIFYINKKSNVNHENDSNEEMIEDAEFREIPNPSGRNASDVIEISYTDSSEDISSENEYYRNAIVLLLETQGKHAKYRKDTSTGRKYQHYNHLNHRKDRGGRPSGRNASDVIEISYTDSSEDISSEDEERNAIDLILETLAKHAKYRKDTSTGRKYQHYNHLNHRKDRGGRHIPQQKDGYDKYRNNRRPWEKKKKKSDYMRQRIAEREEAFKIIQRYAKKKKNKKRGGLGDQSKKKKSKTKVKVKYKYKHKNFYSFFSRAIFTSKKHALYRDEFRRLFTSYITPFQTKPVAEALLQKLRNIERLILIFWILRLEFPDLYARKELRDRLLPMIIKIKKKKVSKVRGKQKKYVLYRVEKKKYFKVSAVHRKLYKWYQKIPTINMIADHFGNMIPFKLAHMHRFSSPQDQLLIEKLLGYWLFEIVQTTSIRTFKYVRALAIIRRMVERFFYRKIVHANIVVKNTYMNTFMTLMYKGKRVIYQDTAGRLHIYRKVRYKAFVGFVLARKLVGLLDWVRRKNRFNIVNLDVRGLRIYSRPIYNKLRGYRRYLMKSLRYYNYLFIGQELKRARITIGIFPKRFKWTNVQRQHYDHIKGQCLYFTSRYYHIGFMIRRPKKPFNGCRMLPVKMKRRKRGLK